MPAYKDFLKKHKISSNKIKTYSDFKKLPVIDKKNYLRVYSLDKLIWGGNLRKNMVFTSTSGSTGAPVYFPRQEKLDWQCSVFTEKFLNASSYGSREPTLVIVGFSMGVWIGGLITYKAFEIAGINGKYPLSIITPGINKNEIFNALKNLSPHYSQTILVGYPPFIKDIIDEAEAHKINLKKLNIRILTAAESYSEKFREYISEKAGVKNFLLDTANIYGSADLGSMAWETPISILIRRLAISNNNLFKSIFGNINKIPTLVQYNPIFTDFEEKDGEILLTGDSVIPLVHYAVGDHGGVYSFSEIENKFKKVGIDIFQQIKKNNLQKHFNQMPFVYVYERKDFSTTIYGLQIYPETIKETLLKKPISNYLTGKFTLETKFDKKHNQYLVVHIEMKKGTMKLPPAAKEIILKMIVNDLQTKNSEFRELHKFLGKRAVPKLLFWSAEDPEHFKPGIKQKWVKK